MNTRISRSAYVLSWVIAALAAAQAVTGLALRTTYRDGAWVKLTWLGNDIVTLAVVVPLLLVSLVLVSRGSRRGELVWFGSLAYVIYNYAYYLFGARINVWFPAYVALFVLGVLAEILALGTADVNAIAASFRGSIAPRAVGGFMVFTGLGLAIAWLAQWAGLVFGGTIPSIGEDAFTLIATLDLSFMVPFYLLGGVLLWRRHPWGYVLGVLMNVLGMLYLLVLTVNSALAVDAGFAKGLGEVPVWGVWVLVSAVAVVWLLSLVGLPGRAAAAQQQAA